MIDRKSVKIAVAETSLILRSGVAAALSKSSEEPLQIMEIALTSNFENKISTFSPNILIVNPLFGGKFNLERYKANKDFGLSKTKIVALLTGYIDPQLLEGYDATLNIYDDSEQIKKLISRMLNAPEPREEASEEQISLREREIILEVVKGLTNKEIADRLNLSIYTVLTHRRNIARKLQIHSSTGLTIYAIANGLLSKDDLTISKKPSVDK